MTGHGKVTQFFKRGPTHSWRLWRHNMQGQIYISQQPYCQPPYMSITYVSATIVRTTQDFEYFIYLYD